MCGICGVYGIEDKKLIREMNSKLIHRGPDQDGYFIDKKIMLGHRRLSIIDLSNNGKQPMHNEDKTIWIVFNGEIYNFKELRIDLEKKGHRFYSNTDTEVIVHGYEEYGVKFLEKLNGMFAFGIWDSKKKLLFLARDRVGVKPLYYYKGKDRFSFASEIKAIIADKTVPREVNLDALNQYIGFEYVPAPLSMFKEIYKLKAGHYLIFKENKINIQKYWDVSSKEIEWNENELIAVTKRLISESVKMRMISDVPLGAFLSGGIDSSTVVSFMSKFSNLPIKTFSIGFSEKSYDESKYARLVAEKFNTEHTESIVDPEDIIPLFDKIIPKLDEPFGDISIFPTYLVSELARSKVTVVLSGDGGDELFGGYDWYLAEKLSKIYSMVPFKKTVSCLASKVPLTDQYKGFVNKFKRFVECYDNGNEMHLRWMNNVPSSQIRDLLQFKVKENSFSKVNEYVNNFSGLNKNMYVDLKTYLTDDIFTKVDRASMFVSMEAREPLVDYRLVEHCMSIPSEFKIKGFTRKYILKKTMRDVLPREIISKEKRGFTLPMKTWIRNELKDLFVQKLSKENLKQIGLFNQEYVDRVISDHMNKNKDYQRHLWSLLSFVLWYENYIN